MPEIEKRYDSTTIALHWAIGIGIVLLAGMELMRGEFPKGSFMREGLKPLHQPLGTLLFGLILVRIFYRFYSGGTGIESEGRLARMAAGAMHVALYGLMVILPLLGFVAVFGRDRAIDFGLFTLALPLKDQLGGLARGAKEVHETLGVAILVLAGVHAAAALFHHYVLRDGVLRQMLPDRTRRSSDSPLYPEHANINRDT